MTETPAPTPDATTAAMTAPAAAPAAPDAAQAEKPMGEGDVRNLQDKFNNLLNTRNEHNDLAKAARTERDQLNEARRSKLAELDTHKAARDAANAVMRTHKELRNQYQDQAKALIEQKKGKTGGVERSLPLTVRKLRNDLQAMVEQQQTTSLSVQKERLLVEKIAETWKELKSKEAELGKQKAVIADMSETDGSIDALFAKADEEHAKVSAAMKEAQAHHESFIAGIKEVRVLVSEANAKHAAFVAHKTKADESHNKAMELREKVMAIRGERKAAFDAERREVREVNTQARRNVSDPKAMDRHNDSLLEQMKKGGKITLGY
jgi:uncharacterized coiled-coil DUF342 family protein